jgi:hypothetical protein
MTQELNNQITGSTDTQSADRSLLEYLKPKSEDRFSKLEAYCDLLSRASSGAFVAANGERREELVPGQFVASISELARKWKWQRATVRSFVEGLVALGQLSYKPFVKSYIFTVNLQQRLSLYVDSADDVLDFCCMLVCQIRPWTQLCQRSGRFLHTLLHHANGGSTTAGTRRCPCPSCTVSSGVHVQRTGSIRLSSP